MCFCFRLDSPPFLSPNLHSVLEQLKMPAEYMRFEHRGTVFSGFASFSLALCKWEFKLHRSPLKLF